MHKRFSLPVASMLTFTFVSPSLHAAPSEVPVIQAQACIVSLCGDSNSNISSQFVENNIYKIHSREADALSNTLSPEIKALVVEQVQLEKDKVQALDLALQDPSPIQSTIKVKELIVLLKLIGEVFNNVPSLYFMGGPKLVTVNEMGLSAYVAGKPQNIEAAIRTVVTQVGLPIFEIYLNKGTGSGGMLKAYLKKKYPALPLAEAIVVDAKDLSSLSKKLVSYFDGVLGKTAGLDIKEVLLSQAATGQDLNASEMDAYIQMRANVSAVSSILDAQIASVLNSYPLSIDQEVILLRKGVYLGNRKQEVQMIDSLNLEKKVTDECVSFMRNSLDGNTSSLRIRKFQPVINEVKLAAESVALRFVDEKDKTTISQAIRQIDFNYPTTNNERVAEIRTALKSAKEKLKQEKAILQEKNRSLIILQQLNDSMGGNVKSLESTIFLESDIYKACKALPWGGAADFAVKFSGKVSVSWYSLAFPDRGAAILAHEIGHVLSTKIRSLQIENAGSQAKFTESLSCVANRNPFLTETVKLVGGANSKWSEEDWADHFSTQVMDELEAKGSLLGRNLNLACSMVDNYENYKFNRITPPSEYTHSTGLLRLLMTAVDRKQVTPQCQEILNQFEPSKGKRCN